MVNAGDETSVPAQGIKFPHATWCGQKRGEKKGRKETGGMWESLEGEALS